MELKGTGVVVLGCIVVAPSGTIYALLSVATPFATTACMHQNAFENLI
jgi:hypothetical protein